MNSRNPDYEDRPANHLVILAYCYKFHCPDYSMWAIKKKVHTNVKSENSLLQSSFCLISLLQRNKKKKLMSIENGPVVTKKEKKGAEGLS